MYNIENKNCFGMRRANPTQRHMVRIISVCLVGNLISLVSMCVGRYRVFNLTGAHPNNSFKSMALMRHSEPV